MLLLARLRASVPTPGVTNEVQTLVVDFKQEEAH